MDKTLLPDKIYDKLKFVAWIIPFAILLYKGLGQFWPLPLVTSICGSLEVIEGVICGMLGVSTYQFNKIPDQTIVNEDLEEALDEAEI